MSDIDLTKLAEPFPAEDVEWRIGRTGKKRDGSLWAKCFAYIDNRAIQQRLDETCGLGGWQNHILKVDGGCLCGISIKVDGEWVTKWDGSDNTDFEAFKGGISGAMKRAASQWGIGRYLYNLEEGFADIRENGRLYQAAGKDHEPFKWNPPQLPDWALPNKPSGEVAGNVGSVSGRTSDSHRATKSDEYLEWVGLMNKIVVGNNPKFPNFGEIPKHLMRMPKVREKFTSWDEVEQCTDLRVFDRFSAIINEMATAAA